MAISTAAQLYDAVRKYLDRDDLTGQIPDFVVLCEARMNNTLRVSQMETTATVTLTDNAGTLPTDFLQARRVRSNASPIRDLAYAEPSWIAEHYPNTATELAEYYTIIGSTISTAPPSTASILLNYYRTIPPLASNASGNWLLTRAPNVYLYGTCLEAAPFLDDDSRIAVWGSLYDRSIEELKGADVLGRFGRAVSRVRGVTP